MLWGWTGAVCFFLLAPILIVIPLSFNESPFLQFPPPGLTTHWYADFFKDPTWTDAFLLSVRVAIGATLIAVVFGTCTAYALARGSPRWRRFSEPVIVLPVVVPVVVFAIAAYQVAGSLDLIGSAFALMLAHGMLALPFVVINVGAALRATDSRLERVAQTLGAGPVSAFCRVTLPTIAPAVAGGGILAFVLSFDEPVVSLFLTADASPTLPVRMYSSVRSELDPLLPVAATLVIGASLVAGLLFAAVRSYGWRRRRLAIPREAQ